MAGVPPRPTRVCLAGMVSPPPPFPPYRHGSTCLPVDYPLYTHLLNPWCMWWKQSNMLYSMYHPPFPPRLSILITIQINTQYKVIICQVLSTVYIHHTSPKAEEGRHTNPSSYIIQTLTCPFLSVICTQLSMLKKLFLPFHLIVFRLGSLGGPVLCVPPIVYYLFWSAHYFSSSYALYKMKKKIPSLTSTCVEQMTNQRLPVKRPFCERWQDLQQSSSITIILIFI